MMGEHFIVSLKTLTISLWLLLIIVFAGCEQPKHIPEALETILAGDGSKWERINIPGFSNDNNCSVVAMAEYKRRLYAVTRNDLEGGEIWRTAGNSWEQVLFPNKVTNGIYGNTWINNTWGNMIVYKDKLYFGFSSGLPGIVLRSNGCEIWRYDGSVWEPVISDKGDIEEAGAITAMSGCADNDGDVTAQITDGSKKWQPDQWAGGVLQITSGNGQYRRFDIIGNSSSTLIVQQNEVAGNVGAEYSICDSKHYQNRFPLYAYDLGAVQVGDSYTIGTGVDENGFGNYWNKGITDMVIHDNKLYVSTGLNYEYGSQVWYTKDGETWEVTQPAYSFGLFHNDSNYPNGKKSVCSSIPCLCSSAVSGSDVLYAGGQGTTGNLGRCARLAKLTEKGWELIVDAGVDDDDTGTNENGFGDGMKCNMFTGNAMPWNLTTFNNMLHASINSLGGTRVLYTPNGKSEDGSWFYSTGGDSKLPNGFDGMISKGVKDMKIYRNIASHLFSHKNYLYAGLVTMHSPAMGATKKYLKGSQIWKSSNGITWKRITGNGFGDRHIISFEAFVNFYDTLYVSGSKGSSASLQGLGGAKVFRLVK
jgi:hypothetical protein